MDNKTQGMLEKLASRIRKDVESMTQPGEKWTVSNGPRITVTLWNPRNENSGHGQQITASNCEDLASIMNSLRFYWEERAYDDDEYAKALLEKCGV